MILGPPVRARIFRLLAWVVTAAALGWLFWKTPVDQVWRAMQHAAPWTVPAIAIAVLLNYVADSFAMWRVFGWFLARLSLREILIVRGATYLLAIINYSVGQGAIVYFVNRVRGAPIMRGVATVLLILGTNLIVLLVLSSLGLLVAAHHPPGLGTVAALGWAGLAIYAVVVALKPGWLIRRPLFDVLLAAGPAGHLKAMLVRLPHIGTLMALNLSALYGFGVQVPFTTALVSLPVVFLIAALPISVQGLGTTQTAMVLFFSGYVPAALGEGRAVVLGASLTTQAVSVAAQVLVGLVCLRSKLARGLGEAVRASQATQGKPAAGGETATEPTP